MGMTSVRMPDDLRQRLDSTATRLRRSKGWIINDAVREYLEREDQRQLRDQPALGKGVVELPEVRELVAGDYVVRYTVQGDSVVVLRVWHGREAR